MIKDIRRIDEWPARAMAALVVGTAFAYIAAYVPLYIVLGKATGILAVVPVITAAWVFGFRIGLLAGFLGVVVNSLLVILVGEMGWREWAADGGLLGTGALLPHHTHDASEPGTESVGAGSYCVAQRRKLVDGWACSECVGNLVVMDGGGACIGGGWTTEWSGR